MSKHHDEEHLSTKQQRLTAKVDDKGRHYCMQEETWQQSDQAEYSCSK